MAKRKTAEEKAARVRAMKDFDISNKHGGFLAGVDEAGRGAIAGPVFAAAVILGDDVIIDGINDSKQLTKKKRDVLFDIIKEKAVAYCVCSVAQDEVERINILQATFKAMRGAVNGLDVTPDFVLVDGNISPGLDIAHEAVIKGDSKSMAVAAASILAKVSRDRYMIEMAGTYPGYGFEDHKGYGTPQHKAAAIALGACELHRRSFFENWLKK